LCYQMPYRKIQSHRPPMIFHSPLPSSTPTPRQRVSLSISCLAAIRSQPHLKQGWFLRRQHKRPSTSAKRCPTAPRHLRHSHDARQTLDLVQMRRATMDAHRQTSYAVGLSRHRQGYRSRPWPYTLTACLPLNPSPSLDPTR
jgi:hypothetical protein